MTGLIPDSFLYKKPGAGYACELCSLLIHAPGYGFGIITLDAILRPLKRPQLTRSTWR